MNKLICIDAGHGGKDSGAVGNGVIEKDITLKTARILGEMLKNQGFNVVFTRNNDIFISLGERCRIANNSSSDLFISVHVNSAENIQARGTETLCYSKNKIAEIVQKNLVNTLKTKDRGVKERKDLYVLNGTKMTAILVELAFLSNKEDAEILKSELFLNNAAEAITKGVCQYFNVKFKENREVLEMKKVINVIVNGKKGYTEGYFADGKNLFTADFIRQLGFNVGFDEKTKQVIINSK